MKPFTLLIKPASADCNLRCEYCFYLGHSSLYPETKKHRMSADVLEKLIVGYMDTEQPNYAFGWQGGEPTIMGLDFFEKVTDLQKKHGRAGSLVSNGLQTNGVLIDDELARHFRKYNFLLGVSLDGPAEIHDHYRRYAGGSGSHADVLKGIEALKRHDVDFNILILVNAANVGRGREVYRYLCDNGFLFHQYIPCVEFDGGGKPMPFTISGGQWGDFLCEVYDEWYKADTRRVSIRFFDSLMTYLVDNVYNICHMNRNCCQYFVVEYNGDIYPCDFFVDKDLRIGNVADTSWNEAQESPLYLAFGRQKYRWNGLCEGCEYLPYCSGDCLKHRLPTHHDPATLSWLCSGWKQFYKHSLPGFRTLAQHIKSERRMAHAAGGGGAEPQGSFEGIGRNDPCPCGSGKKFKKCHGADAF
jgi:uncharacterized protein